MLYDSPPGGEMTFFKDLKSWVRPDEDSVTLQSEISEIKPLFVYVQMPLDLDPVDRTELFANPLQEVLEREKAGTVTGGGSMEPAPDENGNEFVFSGIDVDLYDLSKGLALLQQELVRLQVPPGTLLIYELNGQEIQDPVYPDKVC
jgi:hypothetical protein